MNKEKTVYRVYGSAALKPEYIEQNRSSASIIDFESVRTRSHKDNFGASTSSSVPTWAARGASSGSFVDSLKDAFVDRSKASTADSREVARIIGVLAVIGLVVAFLGA